MMVKIFYEKYRSAGFPDKAAVIMWFREGLPSPETASGQHFSLHLLTIKFLIIKKYISCLKLKFIKDDAMH